MRISEGSSLSDRRVTEWFLREQARKEKEQHPAAPPHGRIIAITISRQFGAGGHTVASKVVEIMGPQWSLWDREIIDQVAQSAQVRSEMVESLDEKTLSWLNQMVRNMLNVRSLEAQEYRRHLVQVLLALAQQGRKVILGRGGNFVLTDALNVRLEASLDFRVRATMERENLSYGEAQDRVVRVDKQRQEFSRGVFERDAEDRSAYDMVLQTDGLGYDAAVSAIVAAARTMFGHDI